MPLLINLALYVVLEGNHGQQSGGLNQGSQVCILSQKLYFFRLRPKVVMAAPVAAAMLSKLQVSFAQNVIADW